MPNDPLSTMPGPDFLWLYVIVIVATVLVSRFAIGRLDSTGSAPPPIPPSPDPYEIAYLRGGENELTRVVIFHLIQRGYLQTTLRKIERTLNPPDNSALTELERAVYDLADSPVGARDVFAGGHFPVRL